MPACTNCHRELVPGGRFCSFCSTPVPTAPAQDADPYIGQTVRGTYFVQARVGGGGTGQVYKATHLALESPVALKLLRKALHADAAVVGRFHREARAASSLQHPNIVRVTDFGQLEDGTLFMAMEFVGGRSLERIIAREAPLPERRVVELGGQLLSALEEAHGAGILHRDLKPENVMVVQRQDGAEQVKVLDFGIAKVERPVGQGGPSLTQAGLVCGTPGYMSPEQWSGDPLDARSDLYAVGVILYELLTGKPPFEFATPLELVRKLTMGAPPPPASRLGRRTIATPLETLVMRALSTDAAARPASAAAMRAELLASLPLATPVPGEHPASTQKKTAFLPTQVAPYRRPSEPASTPSPTPALPPTGGAAKTPVARPVPPVTPPVKAPVGPPRHEDDEPEEEGQGPGAAEEDAETEAAETEPLEEGEPRGALPPWRRPRFLVGAGAIVLLLVVILVVALRKPAQPAAGAAKPGPVATVVPPGMVPLPGGDLLAGRSPYGSAGALDVPPRRVSVRPFLLDLTEVTVDDYRAFVEAGQAPPPWPRSLTDFSRIGRLPVVGVEQEGARRYCQWKGGKRLPTEEEWEWAATGGAPRLFPWGPDFRADCVNGLRGQTGLLKPVGTLACGATPEGVLDLSGNAWEWTATAAALYPGSTVSPPPAGRWVIRGGAFSETDANQLTTTARQFADGPTRFIGFRCAKDP